MAVKPPKSAKQLLTRYAKGERDFRRANLIDAKLIGAKLIDAKLIDADLSGADLSGVNLRDANLIGVNLDRANLSGANLRNTDLDCANLSGANLRGADLDLAKLINAKLIGANLDRANLRGTNLSDAALNFATLNDVNLSGVNLSGADFSGAKIGYTQLGRLSLIEFCKADPPVIHTGPNSIDFESIALSLLAPNLEKFLVRAGIPAIAAQYMIESAQAVKGSVWDMMQSVFISYGSPDEVFARKLYEALHSNGVRTFFFAEHAEPGEKLHRMMRKGVNEHERIVLVCSKASLDRKGVLNEIEETLARETRDGGEAYLIPIRLDDYVFSGWKPARADIAQAVRDRVVADFEGTTTDQAKFAAALSKLLRALRVKNPAPTSP